LADQGDGTYTGIYTVEEGDSDASNVEATDIRLTGLSGTTDPASSTGSTLQIYANSPSIESVVLSPNSGQIQIGDTVTITAIAENNETGLIPSPSQFVGNSVALTDMGDGTYSGTYLVNGSEEVSTFTDNALFSDGFEDGTTSKWTSVSAGVAVSSESKDGIYGVEYDIQSTTQKDMRYDFPAEQDETYTSFFLKLDAGFIMTDGDANYMTTMRTPANGVISSMQLRRSGNDYQMSVYRGGSILGSWSTINRGEWLWVKIHYRNGSSGAMEWWLDDVSQGSYTGDLGTNKAGKFCAMNLIALDASTRGKIFMDNIQITPTDHEAMKFLEVENITLTDAAGNISEPLSPVGSGLVISDSVDKVAPLDITPSPSVPTISSVTIEPNSGTITTGDTVTITVTAGNGETGLTPSPATINGRQVTLTDRGDGTYTGTYTVMANDINASNIEAANITLTGEGGTSDPVTSTGSTLSVDTQAPVVASVELLPAEGTLHVGDTVRYCRSPE